MKQAGLTLLLILSLVFIGLFWTKPLNNTLVASAENELNSTTQSPTLHFIAFGDSGSGMAGQKALSAQLWQQYQTKPFPFVLMLGDNIYPDGNVVKYGKERFLDPYEPLLTHGVKFKPVLGNHDVLGPYKQANKAFFNMPADYYTYNQGPICFYALDTNNFTPQQALWLSNKLQQCPQPWKIVYAHHPVYSSGMHQSSSHLIHQLKPLLEQYNVQLYLAGHDHDYERFAPVNGVHYIVSGGGGASLRKFGKLEAGSNVRQSIYHFLRVDASDTTLQLEAVDTTGTVFDNLVIQK